MKIGMTNSPVKDIVKEIEWASKNGFDYIELALDLKTSPDNLNI